MYIEEENRLKEKKDAVFLPADFDYYSQVSSKAMEIIEKYADVFEYVGRDEAYLDVTKKTKLDFTKAEHLAQQLKMRLEMNLNLHALLASAQTNCFQRLPQITKNQMV